MEFTNTFTIPVDVDEAFAVLTDLERVAPCMPGAKLETVDGDTYTGRVKVKVGPMSLTYKGTAEIVDRDPETHTATIAAKGSEARGGGTANADVTARLTEVEDGTEVVVETAIDVTGKPAQFGRGVMADVGAKIIDTFADCLSRRLAESDDDTDDAADDDSDDDGTEAGGDGAESTTDAAPASAPGAGADTGGGESDGDAETASTAAVAAGASAAATATSTPAAPSSEGPRKVASREPEVESLDVLDVMADSPVKKAVPLLAALTVIGLIIWLVRRGND